jgi:hypothetical protein
MAVAVHTGEAVHAVESSLMEIISPPRRHRRSESLDRWTEDMYVPNSCSEPGTYMAPVQQQ